MENMDKSQILSRLNDTTYKIDTKSQDLEIEVGDVKQPDFKPRLKLKKWDNEVNFSVGVIEDIENPTSFRNEEEKVVWEQGNREAHFYPVDGGYEFEVLLKEKPKSNILEFSIETKGLDFLYQPILTEEERLAKEIERPSNVQGSYAVYHSGKEGDYSRVKGKDYKTGKIFHIYRPKIIDFNGKWAWGKLNIDIGNKLLTIRIPQSILDSGVYPLTVDPTFGYTSCGSSTAKVFDRKSNATTLLACKFSLPENGKVSSITAFTDRYAASGSPLYMTLAIFNNDANRTFNSATNEVSFTTTTLDSEDNFSYSSPISLNSGDYWFAASAYTATDESEYINYDAGSTGQSGYYNIGAKTVSTYNDFPEDMTSFTADDKKFSIYATYEATSSGTEADSERGLYLTGSSSGNSEKGLYVAGSLTGESERAIYTEGEAGSTPADSDRLLYSKGSVVGSSDRLLYTEGSIGDTSDRLVYSKGIATDSGERLIYSKGSIASSSERQLYSKGIDTSSSDRLLHTIGSLSSESDRLLYSKGVNTSSSDRNIHSIGGGITSSDRLLHSIGGGITSSERLLYTLSDATSDSARGLFTKGVVSSSSDRLLYEKGVASSSSDRNIYSEGIDVENESERGIYTKGVDTSSSERNLHTIGGVLASSERGVYTTGRVLASSNRTLYTQGASTGVAKFKRWNGTAWVSVTLKRYNGSTWDTEIIKRYNGSTWEDRA